MTDTIPVPPGATCGATVYPRERFGAYHGHACGKSAKVAAPHANKGIAYYCGIHDPAKVAERRAESDARYRAKFNSEKQVWARTDACRELMRIMAARPDHALEDLPAEAQAAIKKYRENGGT